MGDASTWGGSAYGPTLQTGRWYRVDMRLDTSTATWRLDWRLDGVAQPQVTFGSSAKTFNLISVGSNSSVNADFSYDDLAYSQTSTDYPLEPGKVLGYRPDGLGAGTTGASDFRYDTGGAIDVDAALRFDDLPMSSLSDYVKQVASNAASFVELTFADTVLASNPLGVRAALAYHAAGTAADNGETRIRDGAGQETGVGGTVGVPWDMSETTLFHKGAMVTPPVAGWSPATFNALTGRIGYSTSTGVNPYWDALLLEAEFPDGS
jgi:hypothetical protein